MASEADVKEVKALLDGIEEPWDEAKIGQTLDAVGSVAKTMRAFWSAKVNATYQLLDISESGSSRSMSNIYRNAMEQRTYWDGKVAEDEVNAADPVKGARIHRITRSLS